jgi:hypothetical protein
MSQDSKNQKERVIEQEKLVFAKENKLKETISELQKINEEYMKNIDELKKNIAKEKRALEIFKYQQKLLENFKLLEDHLN